MTEELNAQPEIIEKKIKPKKKYLRKQSQAGYFKTRYYSNPEYRQKHKEKLMVPIECDCGTTVTKCNLGQHKKTKKHLYLMEIKKLKTMDNTENNISFNF